AFGPAAAARYLGHADKTGALAAKNYIDHRQIEEQLPLPPALIPAAVISPVAVPEPNVNGQPAKQPTPPAIAPKPATNGQATNGRANRVVSYPTNANATNGHAANNGSEPADEVWA